MPVNPLVPELYDPEIVGLHANYRFFTTDLVSNEILADIPFKDVSYERAIKSAGQFSGSIEVLPPVDRGSIYTDLANTSALNLYKTTMPGKTGLYVVRTDGADSKCVWGGVIWSRKYDVISRQLQVSAAEFPSYLHHRVAWKTMNHEYVGKVTKYVGGNCLVEIPGYEELDPTTGNTPTLKAGAWVQIVFYEVANFKYNGYFQITALVNADGSSFNLLIPDLPVGTYNNVTVYLRTNTVDYVKSMLTSTFIDYLNIHIPNDEIEPSLDVDLQVTQASVTNEVATIVVSEPHGLIVGQTGLLYNMPDQDYNGTFIVSELVGDYSFKYVIEGVANKSLTPILPRQATITTRKIENYIATVTTSAPHNFVEGDTVVIDGLDDGTDTVNLYDGMFTVYVDDTHPVTATSFSYMTVSLYNKAYTPAPAGAKATVTPTFSSGSYGSFPFNTDILLSVDGDFEDGSNISPLQIRGFELRTIGDILNDYSDAVNGFEYRVDCEYVPASDITDPYSGRFKRTLVLLPIDLPDPTYENGWPTLESFPGATKNIFEYPGNVEQFSMEESAEDATTRFWVAGNIPDLGEDASQPYAGATAKDLISPSSDVLDQDPYAAWPILESVESKSDISDEEELYTLAQRYLIESKPPVTKMTLSVNGSIDPKVGTYKPGDWCSVLVDDPFFRERVASPLEANRDFLIRKIESIKVSVPNMPVFPEQVSLELIPEWQVDKRGQ